MSKRWLNRIKIAIARMEPHRQGRRIPEMALLPRLLTLQAISPRVRK
jgi:hypothetical protein